jgi:hypothetical protein
MLKTQVKYFFQIPIYRCDKEKHKKEMEDDKTRYLKPVIEICGNREASTAKYAEVYFYEKYWYPWNYNEVVGWLDLYAFINPERARVGAYIWYVDYGKIPKRMSKKKFLLQGGGRFHKPYVFEIEFGKPYISSVILAALTEQLEALRKNPKFKKRFIDLERFYELGPHVDWDSFLNFKTE